MQTEDTERVTGNTPIEVAVRHLNLRPADRATLMEEFSDVQQLSDCVNGIEGPRKFKAKGLKEVYDFKLGVACRIVAYLQKHGFLQDE